MSAPDVRSWFLAYFRLEEAVHAAGGVAYHVCRLSSWQKGVAAEIDRLAQSRGLLKELRVGELLELHSAGHTLAEADYLFHDALWWARAFHDRLYARPRRELEADGLMRFLPSDVAVAVEHRAGHVRQLLREARLLTNYSLHAESVNRLPPVVRRSAGEWQIPIPDEVTGRISPNTNFNYSEGRDAVGYYDKLAAGIADLSEALLDEITRVEKARR